MVTCISTPVPNVTRVYLQIFVGPKIVSERSYGEILIVPFMPKVFFRDSCGFWDGSRKLNILLCCDISVEQIVVNIYIGGSCVNLLNVIAFHVPLCDLVLSMNH